MLCALLERRLDVAIPSSLFPVGRLHSGSHDSAKIARKKIEAGFGGAIFLFHPAPTMLIIATAPILSV
jgi:hypothetical protein